MLDQAFGVIAAAAEQSVAPAVKQHALLSPSSSSRWTVCHAAPRREAALNLSRESSPAADWGTIAHDLSERCLVAGNEDFMREVTGREGRVEGDGTVTYLPAGSGHIAINDEMIECVESYVDFIRQLAIGGQLHVEQRLSIEHITGEVGAKGTSDSVIVFPRELCIADLKGGFGRVFAKEAMRCAELLPNGVITKIKPNTQLVMYAEAVRHDLEAWFSFDSVRIIIVQPRLGHVDEYSMPMREFMGWVEWIRQQAAATRSPDAKAVPGEDQCYWCKAYPCAEVHALAMREALDDFQQSPRTPPLDPVELGRRKRLVPLIRQYCDWVEARVRAELEAGRGQGSGYKLVDGDMGDRKWVDDVRVVQSLQSFGLAPTDYTVSKLVGPAAVEKMVLRKRKTPNKKLSVEQWDELQALITRDEGSPKVVPDTDPRPAVQRHDPAADFNFT